MNKKTPLVIKLLSVLVVSNLISTSCSPISATQNNTTSETQISQTEERILSTSTPLPSRPSYTPGELVNYVAQSGDTLPALASRFNTTVDEILEANPFIPREATTMPPGMPMQIPIYYRALWASPFQIIPDHAFVNSPSAIGFNTAAFLASQNGWLTTYRAYVGGEWKTGAELVEYTAINYSINPKLLIAILEYQGGALSLPEPPVKKNLLGLNRAFWDSPYLQLVLAANTLNDGYYGWRIGTLIEFEDKSGNIVRPDPWQNAGSAALQFYFSNMYAGQEFSQAISADGLQKTYIELFGNPWVENVELMPGSLAQPELRLPFPSSQTWSFTGGPHTGWGTGAPLAALDFAPPSEQSGCVPAKPENFSTAMANGLVVRSSKEGVVLDLDLDGDERTGWVLYYLHLATDERAPLGSVLKTGDKIGYPSCEGGRSTGTHVHIARKYNGEWVPAEGPLAFILSGWSARNGLRPYEGTLTKGGLTVIACECGDAFAAISGSYP